MVDNIEINRVIEENPQVEEIPYKYNFINKPWDDRSENSKISIVALLAAIFVATMALVLNNIAIHYRGYDETAKNTKIYCNLVTVDKYPYVARIFSAFSVKPICVAVAVSSNTFVANEVCIKSGEIRLHLGSVTDPRCKKDFSAELIDPIIYDGLTTGLVLITVLGNTYGCIKTIEIGTDMDSSRVHIIGKPRRGDKTLSFQVGKIEADNSTLPEVSKDLSKNDTVCIHTLMNCPVHVGDLLFQRNKIFGIASTSVHKKDKKTIACFTKLRNARTVILLGSLKEEIISE